NFSGELEAAKVELDQLKTDLDTVKGEHDKAKDDLAQLVEVHGSVHDKLIDLIDRVNDILPRDKKIKSTDSDGLIDLIGKIIPVLTIMSVTGKASAAEVQLATIAATMNTIAPAITSLLPEGTVLTGGLEDQLKQLSTHAPAIVEKVEELNLTVNDQLERLRLKSDAVMKVEKERDNAFSERDSAITERDSAIKERADGNRFNVVAIGVVAFIIVVSLVLIAVI
ncbi:MAG: hypothetical protein JW816_00690, partial [Candidatus Buchananbacteria bacterium]|nr:hypothetical protein [Candidatus Buchananbacteria bacterium]